ncbi:MAG: AAA family ATPase [Candidatus Nanoarchaeia archaeon]|nr:AAA family ATPase [Candidatus Nanoarchaeia archaeon]
MPIITITGSDGSGKATQTKILVERAIKEQYKVKTMSFPQYEKFWGKVIKAYLRGDFGTLEQVDPHDASMLYAMDRLEAKPQLLRWLREGSNIILDRYLESNYAHQAGKYKGKERERMLLWLYDLEIEQNEIPESDMVIYLDLPVEWTLKAIEKRSKEDTNRKQDLHESNAQHLFDTQETYRMLANRDKRWRIIPCLKDDSTRYTEEEVAELVWKCVFPILKK